MKGKIKRFIALLLVITLVFSLAACKKSIDTVTTTSSATTVAEEASEAEETTMPNELTALPSETTAETTTLTVETTAAVTTVAGETTTVPPATTAKSAVSINAPVGGSISQIVAFYNQYANATKEYTGKITVQRNMGTVTTISKFGISFLKGLLQSVLDKQLKDKYENKTFVNGKNPTDSNDTLEKFLPRSAGQKMSALTTPGVKSAACVKDGSGWKVTIVLKKEVSGIDTPPKYHSSVMDPLEIDSNSLDPFTLGDGKVVYGQLNAPFDGATLVAIVNPKGTLDHLRMDAPLQISGKLGYKNMGNIDTVIDGKFWGDMTFKYY
ncbi:MAG: hypothetical protein WCN92_03750 [Eubacteriales bacterium]